MSEVIRTWSEVQDVYF